jgi:hypothetical protein
MKMGVCYSAKVIVGFPISEEDLFTTSTSKVMMCSHGHTPNPSGQKFCPEDGSPFHYPVVKEASTALRVLAKRVGREIPNAHVDGDEFSDWWVDFLYGLDPDLHVIETDRQERPTRLVCGRMLLKTGVIEGSSCTGIVNQDDLRVVIKDVVRLLDGLGLEGERRVQLYMVASAG